MLSSSSHPAPRKHTVPTHLNLPDQVLTLWSFTLTARQLLLVLVGGGTQRRPLARAGRVWVTLPSSGKACACCSHCSRVRAGAGGGLLPACRTVSGGLVHRAVALLAAAPALCLAHAARLRAAQPTLPDAFLSKMRRAQACVPRATVPDAVTDEGGGMKRSGTESRIQAQQCTAGFCLPARHDRRDALSGVPRCRQPAQLSRRAGGLAHQSGAQGGGGAGSHHRTLSDAHQIADLFLAGAGAQPASGSLTLHPAPARRAARGRPPPGWLVLSRRAWPTCCSALPPNARLIERHVYVIVPAPRQVVRHRRRGRLAGLPGFGRRRGRHGMRRKRWSRPPRPSRCARSRSASNWPPVVSAVIV